MRQVRALSNRYELIADAADDSGKRSFVGSADFVSPEVLRSEPAVFASDVWAFGCILFQLLAGRPPFRGATDYLTFQRILKRDFQWPTGIDEDAKSLIDQILVRFKPLVLYRSCSDAR